MVYGDDIDALNCDHRWSFDNTLNDQVGSANGSSSGTSFTTDPICEDVIYSLLSDGVDDRVQIPSTTDINNSAQTRKAVAGWIMVTAIQRPPKNIYGEGNTSQAFRFILGFGNNIIFEVDSANFTLQIYGDTYLELNRAYHICMIFEGNGYGNELRAYLDGVEQLNAEPTDRQPDYATLAARSQAEFSDPAGTVAVGGIELVLNGLENGRFNEWATWDGADAVLTDTEVREELFEKGALPDVTISSGTQSAMQTALDVYTSTERSNAPLCIRIEDCTEGNFTLELDDITFDSLASIHVQYTGNDTLTLINTNGSDCSIVSTTSGGTIILKNRVTLTINVKDAETFANIENARVYIETDPGEVELMNELTNSSGIATESYDLIGSSQAIIGRARKGTSPTRYKGGEISGSITSIGFTQTVFLVEDE